MLRSISRSACYFVMYILMTSLSYSKGLTVYWSSMNLHFSGADDIVDVGIWKSPATSLKQHVPCVYLTRKTDCLQVYKKKTSEPYGANLKFKIPIAIFPRGSSASSVIHKESESDDAGHAPNQINNIGTMLTLKLDDIQPKSVETILDSYYIPGLDTESYSFAAASISFGGREALAAWTSLIGKRPSKICEDPSDSCSIVLRGKIDKNNAIAYCQIGNSKIGIGLPYDCRVVAVEIYTEWNILSYDSPKVCDGCGAASGISCTATSSSSLEQVTGLFKSAFKNGKTNVNMTVTLSGKNKVVLVGQNKDINSKFFAGYYDLSFARYAIARDVSENTISIDGVFNLLISADPGRKENYSDFGPGGRSTSDIEWFQGQIIELIRDDILSKIGKDVSCMNEGF